VHDWSTRHVLFSGLTPETVSAAIQSDPRALHSWLDHARHRFESPTQPQPELDERREPADSDRSDDHRRRHHHRHRKKNSLATDWQMPLSLGVGPRSAPAKFGFDLNAVPDCTNDYAVFPTRNSNTPGSIGPNVNATLIAYNNLYTGPGPSGICPTPSAPALLPSVLFAYNTSTVSTGKADFLPFSPSTVPKSLSSRATTAAAATTPPSTSSPGRPGKAPPWARRPFPETAPPEIPA
jgi:hypothetical protein